MTSVLPPCCYDAFTLPEGSSQKADAQLVLNAAHALRGQLIQRVPAGANQHEAIVRLDKAVMVAIGGFHTRERQDR